MADPAAPRAATASTTALTASRPPSRPDSNVICDITCPPCIAATRFSPLVSHCRASHTLKPCGRPSPAVIGKGACRAGSCSAVPQADGGYLPVGRCGVGEPWRTRAGIPCAELEAPGECVVSRRRGLRNWLWPVAIRTLGGHVRGEELPDQGAIGSGDHHPGHLRMARPVTMNSTATP
jgi:hypothetical protein